MAPRLTGSQSTEIGFDKLEKLVNRYGIPILTIRCGDQS